jgi:hypothetical protein
VDITQEYVNNEVCPIEASYVFPLDERAAVCGFEAEISGKRIVASVKEKEQAKRFVFGFLKLFLLSKSFFKGNIKML